MWKPIDKMRFDTMKLLSLGILHIKTYGYSNKSYDRLMKAIERDPQLTEVPDYSELCKEFMNVVKTTGVWTKQLGGDMKNAKLRSVLHSSTSSVGDMHLALIALKKFLMNKDMAMGSGVEKDVWMKFDRIWLKSFLIHGEKYVFKDKDGNWYYKSGNPPGIIMRKEMGSKTVVHDRPYEMHYNDVYSFKAQVKKSYIDAHGNPVNVIKTVMPI